MSCDNVTIGGVKYVPECSVPSGNRKVVVVDRGWIFAGDVERKDGRIYLTRVVWPRNWSSIGFDGVLKDPHNSKVTLKKLDHMVEIPDDAEIFMIPVDDDWGL